MESINYVELPARDLAATKRFFTACFGWGFVDYGDEYIAITGAGLDGGFYASEQCSETANGAALVVLYSAELEASRDRVLQHGGSILRDVFEFPGGRRFHFADPNGNEWAIWSDQAAQA